ncbi:Acylglycerol kinase, mitochondrial [Pseudolycoriella hygida]|uniref:Acylglycerol kinase, mitochondrial n=1 Tax=Pseudolycoriella hygida TaxID=35572 RepID=A0A9Q0S4V7_9DIPT|nr:Acylglycerol kinase, mitochondrial [Pseudolycoriella hygida]
MFGSPTQRNDSATHRNHRNARQLTALNCQLLLLYDSSPCICVLIKYYKRFLAMAKVVKIFTTIRNNWKKSAFAAVAFSYGVSFANEKYEINQLMRKYCEEATTYGDVAVPATVQQKNVLVILNPVADKKSASDSFEKYCAPILHLAGIAIEVLKTDSEGHARRHIEELESLPDTILVAGGDGTVSETITGLLRRPFRENCSIGVLPVGRTNSLATQLYNFDRSTNLKEVEGMANAAISIVRGKTEPKDVMKIEVLQNESSIDSPNPKPVYAIDSLHWGAYRDVWNKRDKYWYFGSLRGYVAFALNAFDNDAQWKCKAKVTFSPPCSGCRNCFVKPEERKVETKRRWWSLFIPKISLGSNRQTAGPDYSKIVNENCQNKTEIDVEPSELLVKTNVNRLAEEIPKISLKIGKYEDSSLDFVKNGWRRLGVNDFEGKNEDVRSIEIVPEVVSTEDKELFFSIDNEAYEVKPVRISVIPRAIQMYTM